jgi:hypothetical protein
MKKRAPRKRKPKKRKRETDSETDGDESESDNVAEPEPEPEAAEAERPAPQQSQQSLLDWLLGAHLDLLACFVEQTPDRLALFSFHTSWIDTLWTLANPTEKAWLASLGESLSAKPSALPPRLFRCVAAFQPWRASLQAWLRTQGTDEEIRERLLALSSPVTTLKENWAKLANLLHRRKPTLAHTQVRLDVDVIEFRKHRRKWLPTRVFSANVELGQSKCSTTSPSIQFRLKEAEAEHAGVFHAAHGAVRAEVTLGEQKLYVFAQPQAVERVLNSVLNSVLSGVREGPEIKTPEIYFCP